MTKREPGQLVKVTHTNGTVECGQIRKVFKSAIYATFYDHVKKHRGDRVFRLNRDGNFYHNGTQLQDDENV